MGVRGAAVFVRDSRVEQRARLTKSEMEQHIRLMAAVGVIPTALGEGLKRIPHGSDWSSIREAGMNVDKLGAQPGDAASRDEYGYAQEGNKTVVTLNQRNQAYTLEPKGTGERVGLSRHDQHSPHE